MERKRTPRVAKETHPNLAIVISSEILEDTDEAGLMGLAFASYRAQHPQEKPEVALALAAKCDPKTVQNALAGKTKLGTIAWLRIERLLGIALYDTWVEAQRRKLDR